MRCKHLIFFLYVLQLRILNLGEWIGEVTTINPSSLTPILESQIRAEAWCYAIYSFGCMFVCMNLNAHRVAKIFKLVTSSARNFQTCEC